MTITGDRGERAAKLIEQLAELEPDARSQPELVRVVRAPGRVNLIGEHTDYNLGYVLPAAISLETWIASLPRDDGKVSVVSLQEPDEHLFDLADPGPATGQWRDYVAGVATTLAALNVPLRGITAVTSVQAERHGPSMMTRCPVLRRATKE